MSEPLHFFDLRHALSVPMACNAAEKSTTQASVQTCVELPNADCQRQSCHPERRRSLGASEARERKIRDVSLLLNVTSARAEFSPAFSSVSRAGWRSIIESRADQKAHAMVTAEARASSDFSSKRACRFAFSALIKISPC